MLYLLELLFVESLQPLLAIIELLDPVFVELMAPGQQIVQALQVQVLRLLSVADSSEPMLLFRGRKVNQDVCAAQPTKR